MVRRLLCHILTNTQPEFAIQANLRKAALEARYCLLFYSNGIEGYREQSLKSTGKKWHLGRVSWEKKLKEAGFELVKRYRGLRPNWQFVWLLK